MQEVFAAVFDDQDQIIEAATERAKQLSRQQQDGVAQVKRELTEADRKIQSMMNLLTDPDVDKSAKGAISRQVGVLEQKREELHATIGRLATEAGETTERLAVAVRLALEEARKSLAAVRAPAAFNRFVARFVGPFVVCPDGSVAAKKNPVRCFRTRPGK